MARCTRATSIGPRQPDANSGKTVSNEFHRLLPIAARSKPLTIENIALSAGPYCVAKEREIGTIRHQHRGLFVRRTFHRILLAYLFAPECTK